MMMMMMIRYFGSCISFFQDFSGSKNGKVEQNDCALITEILLSCVLVYHIIPLSQQLNEFF